MIKNPEGMVGPLHTSSTSGARQARQAEVAAEPTAPNRGRSPPPIAPPPMPRTPARCRGCRTSGTSATVAPAPRRAPACAVDPSPSPTAAWSPCTTCRSRRPGAHRLIGPNGAGKTTAMDAICGVPAAGASSSGGRALRDPPPTDGPASAWSHLQVSTSTRPHMGDPMDASPGFRGGRPSTASPTSPTACASTSS